MATSSFKSTTKRSPIGTSTTAAADSSSSNRAAGSHRRSRSLSRFSHRTQQSGETPSRKGKFVNTTRGSEFPEISLDDLALEFFESGGRGRSVSWNDDVSSASQRRGRSKVGDGKGSGGNSYGGGRVVSECNSRRRRSVSVARCQISDSESDKELSRKSCNFADMKGYNKGNTLMPLLQRPTALHPRPVLGRSLSQKDFSKLHDGYSSSQSSALTDDDTLDSRSSKNGAERTIRAVFAQKKIEHPIGDDVNGGFYEVMRKELRHVVEEIRMDLEQAVSKTKTCDLPSSDSVQSKNSDIRQDFSPIRRNYTSKLGQPERRNQELLAEIQMEVQRSNGISKFEKDAVPDAKNSDVSDYLSRTRKRSKDRNKLAKQLIDEADKHIEDFLSNVEDTDISSLDGERSDSSSTLGGITKPRNSVVRYGRNETFQSPVRFSSIPVEMDGVVLPWLQWETSFDASPLSCNKKIEAPMTPKTRDLITAQEEQSNYPTSSRGSSSPGVVDGPLTSIGGNASFEYRGNLGQSFTGEQTKSRFDMEEYLDRKRDEDLLFERWKQQNRINSGGLLLCNMTHYF